MSTPYTPSPTYHSTISVTVDGDDANATEFNTPYQQCADNAAFCRNVIAPLINGGAINPASAIFFNCTVGISGGHDLFVDNNFTVAGLTTCASINASGAINAASNITSTGGAIVASAGNIVASAGNIIASAGNVTAGGTITAASSITSTAGAIVAAAGNIVASAGNIEATGGTLTIGGTTSLIGAVIRPLLFSGLGHLTFNHVTGTDAAAQHYSAKYNWINWFPLVTINRTAIIDSTDQVNGTFMLFTLYASTQSLTIDLPGSAGAFVFPGDSAAHCGIALFDGSQWTAITLT